jgi:hypothetical protein
LVELRLDKLSSHLLISISFFGDRRSKIFSLIINHPAMMQRRKKTFLRADRFIFAPLHIRDLLVPNRSAIIVGVQKPIAIAVNQLK